MMSTGDTLLQGIAHHQAGRLAEAAVLYRRVLDADPEEPDALHLLGVAVFRQGDPGAALGLIDRALARSPAMSQAHYNRANVLRALGRMEEAVDAYRAAAGLAPDFHQCNSDLADALRALGRHGDAADALAGVAAALPSDPACRFRLGEALDAAGRLDEALAAFRDVIVLKPDHGEAFRRYSRIATEIGNADRIAAAVAAGRALPQVPEAVTIYLKAYSRPFYLDRTIRSIQRLVTGYDRIVVLNDGLGPAYIDKLRRDHPTIDVRTSPKVAGNVIAAPANPVFASRKKHFRELDFFDPARFWWREIARDPKDHIVVVDEDCWFHRPLDLTRLIAAMRAHGCLGVGLQFEKDEHRVRRKEKNPTVVSAPVGEADVTVDLYRARLHGNGWGDGYDIFPNTQSVLLKDYWLNNYDEILHFTNEMHLNERAIRLFGPLTRRAGPLTLGFVDGGVLKHSTTSTSRSDAGGKGCLYKIDPDLYHDLVSDLWLAGAFDPMADFPDDYSTDRLVGLMRGRIPDDKIQAWMEWRIEFLRMFYWL